MNLSANGLIPEEADEDQSNVAAAVDLLKELDGFGHTAIGNSLEYPQDGAHGQVPDFDGGSKIFRAQEFKSIVGDDMKEEIIEEELYPAAIQEQLHNINESYN